MKLTPRNSLTSTAIGVLKLLPVLALGGCSAVQLVNSVSRIHAAEVQKNIVFGSNPRHTMDVYLPTKPTTSPSTSTPVVVFFYGGSWNRGEKSEYEFVGRKLASMGYITAIPNYRVYPEVKYPDFLNDGAKATAKLVELLKTPSYQAYKPDAQVVFMGHSAGAYNAAMLALDDRWLGSENLQRSAVVKGLIGLAGAYNIYPIFVEEVRPVFDHPNYPPKSQPIDFTPTAQVPTLLLAPETDELVSIEKNTLQFNAALQRDGSPSRVETVKGTDHITILGTLSPVLFFKGSSTEPIQKFMATLKQAKQPMASTPAVSAEKVTQSSQ